ncbi:MAG: dihydroorotate dehydrogenase electron transfer subunit [Christensenellales bacterium]
MLASLSGQKGAQGKMSVGKILKNVEIAREIYFMRLERAETLPCWPGQFIHIQIPGRREMLLRRPISVNNAGDRWLELVYQVAGEGTRELSQLPAGTGLDYVGPVGRGFSLPDGAKDVWLVGGGAGIAPLKFAAAYFKGVEFTAFLGYKSVECAYQTRDFEKLCSEVLPACEDGALGYCGYIADVVEQELRTRRPDFILACGPTPMLAALQRIAHGVRGQISLEQRMGCGVGACRACACKTAAEGAAVYARVCVDGPVLDLAEVVFE